MKRNILTEFFRSKAPSYIFGIIIMFMSSYIPTLYPAVLGDTIDIMKEEGFNAADVHQNIGYILIITILSFILTMVWRNIVMGNSRKLECYLRENLLSHFQKLPVEFYSRRKTGDLIAYAINDISAVRIAFGPAITMSMRSLVICFASIFFMITSVDYRLTLSVLVPLPLVIYIMLKIGSLVKARFKTVQEMFSAVSDRVQENIYGIRVIKSYVQEDKEIENFEKLNKDMMDANVRMVRTSSYLSPSIELCFSLSFAVSLIYGGSMVSNGTISLGDFIAFNTYLAMILAPIVSIGRVINNIQRGLASYARLNEIFSEPEGITSGNLNSAADNNSAPGSKFLPGSPASPASPSTGEIEFRNLCFSYPGSNGPALRNISFKVGKGQSLGIVGKTGSGKTTLTSLLLRLYNVEPGSIFLDGLDINSYSVEYVRENIGFVPQDIFLFSATVKDNIAFFKSIYSDSDVERAARNSCIYRSIAGLPEGFESVLGERGINLSGGQKQRMTIARAIIKDPPILILDDALSSVDTETESHILDIIRDLRKDKTTIIIAHRISTVEKSDMVVVLENGSVSEMGTHKDLMLRKGLYHEICTEQAKDRRKI